MSLEGLVRGPDVHIVHHLHLKHDGIWAIFPCALSLKGQGLFSGAVWTVALWSTNVVPSYR